MKKRILCFFLVLVLLLPPLSALTLADDPSGLDLTTQKDAPDANAPPEAPVEEAAAPTEVLSDAAESTPVPDAPLDSDSSTEPEQPKGMRTSEEGIALIKSFEGFSPKVVPDVGQWAIGYGTSCGPYDYPYGITEEEADEKMREALAAHEASVNSYIDHYGITLTQAQFDVLASMTYNLGSTWIRESYRFWMMLRNGIGNYSENEIASALGVWCHAGSPAAVHRPLLPRRIREVQLFLYGDYTGTSSPGFCYLIFDKNGGGEMETDVRLYKTGEPYQSFPSITRSGYYFAGWYTEDGRLITANDLVREDLTVYAAWSETPVEQPEVTMPFSDIQQTDWFTPYVLDLHDAHLINGYSDATFHPNAPVTVAEALKLVLLAVGLAEQEPVGGHWAGGYRAFALEYNFLSEDDLSDGLDAPADRILIAKLTARALGLRRNGALSPFADTEDDNVVALYHAKIIEGSINSATGERFFYPNEPIKRSEIAKIVWMLYRTVRGNY